MATRSEATTRFYLWRIPLDRQGYTKGKYPRYYGVGAPLFGYESEDGSIADELRAADRADAKRKIRSKYKTPGATFHR
jgi:hypothetical protein